MKSPFPGMNPWLEKHWGDVHTSLITYIRDNLQLQLPNNLVAQAEESVFVDTSPEESRWIKPDVSVIKSGDPDYSDSATNRSLTADKPIVISFPEETARWVEIRDLDSDNQVVTVIEILSPRNKLSQAGRADYRKKQREYFEAAVNLVEIDLLRTGKRIFLAYPSDGIDSHSAAPYYVSVARGISPCQRELYPLPLHKPLANIGIPLRETDEDAVLPLQTLIDRCYEMGRYDRKINYSEQPLPSLESDDWQWAQSILKGK